MEIRCEKCKQTFELDEKNIDTNKKYNPCLKNIEFLKYHYIKLKKPTSQIAKEFGICRSTIISRLQKLKIIRSSSESKMGDKNPIWKGENVGYESLHDWIKSHKPKKELCEECGIKKPYDLANISGNYKRDINDFEWLCRSCHMKKDGRINNLKQFKKKNDYST